MNLSTLKTFGWPHSIPDLLSTTKSAPQDIVIMILLDVNDAYDDKQQRRVSERERERICVRVFNFKKKIPEKMACCIRDRYLAIFFELPPGITLSKEIYDASAIVDHAISACDNDCSPCDEHEAVKCGPYDCDMVTTVVHVIVCSMTTISRLSLKT